MSAAYRTTQNVHTYNLNLQAEYDRLRVKRDNEQQQLADDRAQGDCIISNRVFELRELNYRVLAFRKVQRKFDTINKVSERLNKVKRLTGNKW